MTENVLLFWPCQKQEDDFKILHITQFLNFFNWVIKWKYNQGKWNNI